MATLLGMCARESHARWPYTVPVTRFSNTKGESMPLPLAPEVVSELRRQFPGLREDYFNYLMFVGWGETEAGPMIYEGPTTPEEIYGPRDELADILLLGDDFQGYCFGYNSITGCYGEVSNSGSWEPWPPSAGFARYISGPSENAT